MLAITFVSVIPALTRAEDGTGGSDGDGIEQPAGDTGTDGEQGDNGEAGSGEQDGEEIEEATDPGENGDPGDAGENGGTEEDGEQGESGENATGGDTGTEGEEGQTGNEHADGNGDNSSVETGDAISETDIANEVNTNDETTNEHCVAPAETAGEGQGTTEEGTVELTEEQQRAEDRRNQADDRRGTEYEEHNVQPDEEVYIPCEEGVSGSGSTGNDHNQTSETIHNENTGVIGNEVNSGANSGENTTNDNLGNANILTGNAFAIANIFNLLNTNIINSEGLFLILNGLLGGAGNLDLRTLNFFGGNDSRLGGSGCDSLGCDGDIARDIINDNNATIVNDVIVRAQTGANEAINNAGDVNVGTGDAYAGANVVNVANTNFIDSKYLLLVANLGLFGNGDIVFPSAYSDWFKNLFGTPQLVQGNGNFTGNPNSSVKLGIDNNNNAEIENNIETNADSGNNEALNNDDGSHITTGDAFAGSSVVNEAGTNLFGADSFVFLFKIPNWLGGSVFGLPDGFSWNETDDGIVLFNDQPSVGGSNGGAEELLDEEGGDEQSDREATRRSRVTTRIENNNQAAIKNNIKVFALTGDNKLNDNGGEAVLNTGRAAATANVVNIANTNVIGSNWVRLIVNILGNWEGNIYFGRSNLWVGGRAEVPGQLGPGDPFTLHYTVTNFGDADATNVKFSNIFEGHEDLITINSCAAKELGTLLPTTSVEFTCEGRVSNDIPYGETTIESVATVQSDGSDENAEDNSETLTITALRQPPQNSSGGGGGGGGGGVGPTYTPDANLRVVKTNEGLQNTPNAKVVDYKIIIRNEGAGPAYHATLYDDIEGPDGELMNTQDWFLGTIQAGEEITVTYSTVLNKNAEAGTYTNTAWVEAIHRHPSTNPFLGYFADSNFATSWVEVEAGEVVDGGDGFGIGGGGIELDENGEDTTVEEEAIEEVKDVTIEEESFEQEVSQEAITEFKPIAFASPSSVPSSPFVPKTIETKNGSFLALFLHQFNFYLIIVGFGALLVFLLLLLVLRRKNYSVSEEE
ncbi:MAG: hypothetical protein COU08_04645 [Candidatus Harrisonbacteria bacterium CG10_big_fil_rev_8_21_14_0_10_42_17]|uniref:DUF11 domain-containing protein n=1 Tax=Candidatus Harrisonbacteria bacterium CG10_big_fil_rev_8_21_14_0_10_42_17 TaxID=1974584 RepID=A0A2M6WH37_9BACT|nr:MAG: hypothetical protein COU08_04645 [Candidatus Harrisonbacteria bacterium CG10_big_fil_rev_8_21_14_0_10_42_17]